MINTKRGILSAILAILCVVALALGVSFIIPKTQKLTANAAVRPPTLVTGAVNGNFVTGIWLNPPHVTNGCSIYESSPTTALNSGYYRFSIRITVPAYTEYTVSYPMGVCAGLNYGTGVTYGSISLERYEDNTYSTVKETYSYSTWYSANSAVTSYYTNNFTVSNLIFSNDTGSPKDFYTYFCVQGTTESKSAATAVYFAAGFGDAYTVEVTKLPAPTTSDTLTVDYDGNPHTVNFEYAKVQPEKYDLDGNAVAYTSGYKNVTVTVSAVNGNGSATNTYTLVNNGSGSAGSEGSGSITATEAGTYTVKFSLSTSAINNGIEWDGGGTADKTLVLTINKIDPTVNVTVGEGTWYPSNELNRDISLTTEADDTPGTVSWDEGQSLSVGTNNYTWTFTPNDTNNYKTKTGVEAISVSAIEITGIRVVFNQGSTKFYTSNSIDALKTRMAVFKVYNDGSESAVDASGYELDGDISEAGTVTVGVIYTSGATELPALVDFTGSFDAVITEVNLVSISASFDAEHTVYLSDGLDSLKDYLTVNGESNDGSAVNGITAYTLSTESGGLSVGTVTVKVTYDNDDSVTTTFTVQVESDPVVTVLGIPRANELTYTGETFEIVNELANLTPGQVATYLDVTGTASGKNAGEYTVRLKIKDDLFGSVVWESPASATTVSYGLTARPTSAQLSADGTTVELKWYVLKAKVTAVWDEENCVWVPVVSQLAETTESNFLTQVYTNSDGKEFTNRDNLAGGRTYQVTARITTQYANNFELDESTQALMNSGSETYTYTPVYVPTIWEKILQFLKANWLWIVIAAASLILLIIIIAVAVKRRKTREERAEKKAAEKERREEEKRRKEEERQRREEERRAQKEKLDAERELAKAKQEAELEKLRAQAGMGMAATAISQPVQQPIQQPVQQPQQPQPMPQYIPQPVPQYYQMPMPQPMPQYAPMPQQSADGAAIARLEAQINAMQAEQRARYDAEQRAELAVLRAEQSVDRGSRNSIELAALREQIRGGNVIPDYGIPHAPQSPAMDMLGALVVAALKNIATAEKPAPAPTAIPQNVEESTQSGHAQYPSDAVITTTTTVDTTKGKPVTRTREDNSDFDVDGFYDSADY